MEFNDILAEIMIEKDLTCVALSKEIGVINATVSAWRSGKSGIKLSNLLKLADYFNCSIQYLTGRTEKKLDYVPQVPPPFYTSLKQVMQNHKKTRYRMTVKDKIVADTNFVDWSRGSDPSLKKLIDLADYFSITIDELVGREK